MSRPEGDIVDDGEDGSPLVGGDLSAVDEPDLHLAALLLDEFAGDGIVRGEGELTVLV